MPSEVYKPTAEELELLKRWYAPDVSEDIDNQRTNAFRMNVADLAKPTVTEPEPQSEVEQGTLSAQALEEITQQAQAQGYEEGLIKGKEEGLLQGHETGYEQGLAQGIEEGRAQGLEQVQPEIEQRVALMDAMLTRLQLPIAHQAQQIEHSLLQLALTLARKVIHCEISQNTQPIINAVSEGVKLIGTENPVNLRVNPQDIMTIEQLYSEQQRRDKNLIIDPDASLAIGDCVLETHNSSVSLNLEERINQVFDDFSTKPQPEHEIAQPLVNVGTESSQAEPAIPSHEMPQDNGLRPEGVNEEFVSAPELSEQADGEKLSVKKDISSEQAPPADEQPNE